MSKIFYDHLVELKDVEKALKKSGLTHDEKVEIWHIVDEMVHHRVIGCILDKLPKNNHEEFLHKFGDKPHDDGLLEYLKSKVGGDIEEFIKKEVMLLESEIHSEIHKKLT